MRTTTMVVMNLLGSRLEVEGSYLADKFGRKMIVLLGLMSAALGTFLFGFSPNFVLAFGSRLFAGTSLVVVVVVMVVELKNIKATIASSNEGVAWDRILQCQCSRDASSVR